MYGAERVVLTLLENIKVADYHCILGCIRESYDQEVELAKQAERKGIDIIYFSMHRGLNVRGIVNIYKYIKKNNIKIVHSHGYKPNIFLGFIPQRYLKAKIITTIHGWAKEFAGSKQAVYEKLNCFFIKRFSRCVAVSKAVYNDMIKRQIPSKKITIIYNGIDFNIQETEKDKSSMRKHFNIPNDAFVIGTAGRLVKEKGMEIFIRGAALFLKNNPKAFFLIAGDGPLLASLQMEVKRLGIEENILFLGFIDRIYDYLSILDIFVLSSLTEGLPMILLEAMNAGCPVVCSNVGGIPEVVDDKINGEIIEPGDAKGLNDKLLLLYKNEILRNEVAVQNRKKVYELFSAETMASKYIELYKTLL